MPKMFNKDIKEHLELFNWLPQSTTTRYQPSYLSFAHHSEVQIVFYLSTLHKYGLHTDPSQAQDLDKTIFPTHKVLHSAGIV